MTQLRAATEALFREKQGSDLADWIAERRKYRKGGSWREIADDLCGILGYDITHVTLINWYSDSDDGPAAA